MKLARLLSTTFAASLFLISCGSADETTTTTDEVTTTAEATSTVAKVPETPTTTAPADIMLMQFKVADYAKWQAKFESRDSVRKPYGLTNYVAGRGLDDPSRVIAFLKMDDPNKAKELTASQGMKDRMKEAGVTGTPQFTYLETVMDDNSTIPQTNRLIMTAKVKDFDAWKKEFDSHKQARVDNGLIDRAIGYSVDDKQQVVIVFAVTDMAKAKAFLQSTDLKDKMDKAGVIGKPTPFFYNIEKMYH